MGVPLGSSRVEGPHDGRSRQIDAGDGPQRECLLGDRAREHGHSKSAFDGSDDGLARTKFHDDSKLIGIDSALGQQLLGDLSRA